MSRIPKTQQTFQMRECLRFDVSVKRYEGLSDAELARFVNVPVEYFRPFG